MLVRLTPDAPLIILLDFFVSLLEQRVFGLQRLISDLLKISNVLFLFLDEYLHESSSFVMLFG